jgi:glyoxylase-like metal-dependent hydrolase (beta-lactamase superfamily II)
MSESRTSGVSRIEFEVGWPPGHVACYVLDGDEPVLVDAGMPDGDAGPSGDEGDGEREATLRGGLAEVGLEPADIAHLVVTHPHVDHVGQVPAVLDGADPTVYAPAGVEERFGRDAGALGERVRRNAREVGIEGELLEEAVDLAVGSLERDRSLLPPGAVDRWIADGEHLSIGGHDLTAVHAPGHQADHLCFEVELDGERALLAGDMAMEPFRGVAIHDGLDDGVHGAFEAFYDALDRLSALPVDRVYPGHGPVHGEFERVVTRDRRSLDRRLDGVEAAVRKGLRTVPAVTAEIAGERPARYVLPEVYGALSYLESEGRVRVNVEDGVRHYDV